MKLGARTLLTERGGEGREKSVRGVIGWDSEGRELETTRKEETERVEGGKERA